MLNFLFFHWNKDPVQLDYKLVAMTDGVCFSSLFDLGLSWVFGATSDGQFGFLTVVHLIVIYQFLKT